MNLTTTELETIGLCIATEAVGDIVNHALLEINWIPERPGEATVRFATREHQELFLIRLLDFASESGNRAIPGVSGSCLEVLIKACETRSFDVGNSVAALAAATERLRNWLDTASLLKMWLPTINIQVTLKIPRVKLLYISGNRAKHNISRLNGIARYIQQLLADDGHRIPLEEVRLALGDFKEHLNENFFVYYATWLAELLNDLRWGIQRYLRPLYEQSYISDTHLERSVYSYTFPPAVVDDISQSWYWRLMDHVRLGPFVSRFSAAEYLKVDR